MFVWVGVCGCLCVGVCVRSRNLTFEAALGLVGLLRQRKKTRLHVSYKHTVWQHEEFLNVNMAVFVAATAVCERTCVSLRLHFISETQRSG